VTKFLDNFELSCNESRETRAHFNPGLDLGIASGMNQHALLLSPSGHGHGREHLPNRVTFFRHDETGLGVGQELLHGRCCTNRLMELYVIHETIMEHHIM